MGRMIIDGRETNSKELDSLIWVIIKGCIDECHPEHVRIDPVKCTCTLQRVALAHAVYFSNELLKEYEAGNEDATEKDSIRILRTLYLEYDRAPGESDASVLERCKSSMQYIKSVSYEFTKSLSNMIISHKRLCHIEWV